MSIIQDAEGWLLGIALKKGLITGVQALLALLVSKGITAKLATYGITIDNAALLASVAALSEVLRNWAKQKFGTAWI